LAFQQSPSRRPRFRCFSRRNPANVPRTLSGLEDVQQWFISLHTPTLAE
jgi:hypothetical protein